MNAVVIVAGGRGARMGTSQPKQFLLLAGKPVLMHTINRFYRFDPFIKIVVALPQSEIDNWNELCRKYDFNVTHTVVCGGDNRFSSVKNALEKTKECDYIAVHDGVRPLVAIKVINDCFNAATVSGALVPVVMPIESLRKVKGAESVSVVRADYRVVQTPQVFANSVLYSAYEQPYSDEFTDDASVVEKNGHPVTLAEGNYENIKITTPQDLALAEILFKDL